MNQDPMKQAHSEAERLFRELLPGEGLAVREEQLSLCHTMLDALFQNKIALCDAGVGIGKTYAYLAACILWRKHSRSAKPIAISTSSIALQTAILKEYLPFLSQIFLENRLVKEPIRGIIRKSKERFVCDERLRQRLAAVRDKQKNPAQRKALDSLKRIFDLDAVPELSGFDRRQVCIPQVCPENCPRKSCRYRQYLKKARSGEFAVQICNHNYLLADAIHRMKKLPPLLGDFGILVVDEAHKLSDAAAQMTGQSLSEKDAAELAAALSAEGYPPTPPRSSGSGARPCGPVFPRLPGRESAPPSGLIPGCKPPSNRQERCFITHSTGAPFPAPSNTGWEKRSSFSGHFPAWTGGKFCTSTMAQTKRFSSAPPAKMSRNS